MNLQRHEPHKGYLGERCCVDIRAVKKYLTMKPSTYQTLNLLLCKIINKESKAESI